MTITSFNIRQTDAYRAVKMRRVVIGMLASTSVALVFALLVAGKIIPGNTIKLTFSIILVLLGTCILELFRRSLLRQTERAEEPENFAEILSYHMVLHWTSAGGLITPQKMLEAALKSERGMFVVHSIGVDRADVLATLVQTPLMETMDTCLQWCRESMKDLEARQLDSTVTIYAFFSHVPALIALIEKADLTTKDLTKVLKLEMFHYEFSKRKQHCFSPETLVRQMGSIGRSWSIGYNTDLETITTNLSTNILHHRRSAIIHTPIIANAVHMLEGDMQSNILLLGKAGTGRRTMIRNIAHELRKHELRSSAPFSDFLILKTAMLLSGNNSSDQALFHALSDAVQGGRFVLVIEDIALLLKAADPRLKEVLFNVLTAKNIRTICIATPAEYHALIAMDPMLLQQFNTMFVEDADDQETLSVLLETYFAYETKKKIRITYQALKSLIDLTKRYVGIGGMPGKAIDILQETLESMNGKSTSIVTEDHIRAVISKRTRIDIQALNDDGKSALLDLKERLQRHVVGQEHAIDSLVAALKRGRLHIGNGKRPVGTFLFLGTTGLGKTETAKALATEYFGSEENMIRIDLNEYGNESSIPLLIGGQTDRGFTEGLLTTAIQDHPSSLVLLDEIEKAHPKILNLFLQILDEGFLTFGDGEKADFRNAIIIATSNAGSHWISANSRMQQEETAQIHFRKALLETIIGERTFSPEFINRFDEVIVFSQPDTDDAKKLATLMLREVTQHFFEEKGVRIEVDNDVIHFLAEKGFSSEYGAREMRRTITTTIENYLADYILKNTIRPGDVIHIQRANLQ